jgi:hypothetical protein
MNIAQLALEIILTTISLLTMAAGVKTLIMHSKIIIQSKTQFWFYIMSLLCLMFSTALMWIPYDRFKTQAMLVYSGCNITQAAFLWCQLLNFTLLYKSLSDYTVCMSSCDKLKSCLKL